MEPIYTITLNPALDIETTVGEVRAGIKLRCTAPRFDPGGGGVNISRVIARLGGPTLAFVALAGPTGDRVAEELTAERIAVHRFPSPGETRQGFSVTETSSGRQFRFMTPGPTWKRADTASALKEIARTVRPGSHVVLSGSLPPGVPPDFPRTLAQALTHLNVKVALDTSGPALAAAASGRGAPLDLLRMDDAEAEALVGHVLVTRGDTADFAQQIVRRGAARIVVIARGGEGSVMATADRRSFAQAPKVTVKSKIGAGDSFMGAMILALASGKTPERAHQEGMAAASAAVTTSATELCGKRKARQLIGQTEVSAI